MVKETRWVYDKDMTHFPELNYLSLSTNKIIGFYIIYILLWVISIKLLKLFSIKYDNKPIIISFIIGFSLIVLFDFINQNPWEISISAEDSNFYLYKPLSEGDAVLIKNDDAYKFPNKQSGGLIDKDKLEQFVKEGKVKYISLGEWVNSQFSNTSSDASLDFTQDNIKTLNDEIKLLINSSYYLFTMLITLAAVSFRFKKSLFFHILPWLLICAIVGIGSVFSYFWGNSYADQINHLIVKKKLLITAISFSLAACFSVLNNI